MTTSSLDHPITICVALIKVNSWNINLIKYGHRDLNWITLVPSFVKPLIFLDRQNLPGSCMTPDGPRLPLIAPSEAIWGHRGPWLVLSVWFCILQWNTSFLVLAPNIDQKYLCWYLERALKARFSGKTLNMCYNG